MSVELDTVLFGCRIATGRRDKDGYVFHGRTRAHQVAWEAANGPVPDGKVLDHACNRRDCCAVWHLEPVTQRENLLRRSWRYRSKLKLCATGRHELKLTAIVTDIGGRVCRDCNREAK